MVAVDPHGNFTTKTILDVDDDLVSMNFLTEGINEVVLFENLLTEEELSEEDELERPEDIVLVVKVIDKNVATEFIKDQFGHDIAPREPYLTVVYLDYKYQTKQHVQFGMPKNATYIYIHIEEVFATNIQMNNKLTMDIAEYRSLCQELY